MPIQWPTKYNKTTNRHNEWSALKKKHADAIKKSKINFDADLGGAIDGFENHIKKVASEGFGATATLQDLEKVSVAGLQAKKVAAGYKSKVAALPDPAKKELTAFLAALEADALLWADSTLAVASPNANWKSADWASCAAMSEHVVMLIRHCELALKGLEHTNYQDTDELKTLYAMIKSMGNTATTAAPVAKRLEGLAGNALKNDSYVGVFKAEAAKAMAGPLLTLHQQIAAIIALVKSDQVVRMNFTNPDNLGSRGLSEAIKFIDDSLTRFAKAEKSLQLA